LWNRLVCTTSDYPPSLHSVLRFPPIIGSPARPYFLGPQGHEAHVLRDIASNDKGNDNENTVLTILAVSLLAASTVQPTAAAEHRHARKFARAAASEQFRNANNAVPAPPAQRDWQVYSNGYMAGGY